MASMTGAALAGQYSRPSGKSRSKLRGRKVVESAREATVLVLDDDTSVCRSLKRLISASGFQVKTFGRPSELLASEIPRANACMVVDINLPEMTGVQMCEILKNSGRALPTILITGRTDRSVRSLTAKSDAIALLFKPFDEDALLDAIGRALALSAEPRSDGE